MEKLWNSLTIGWQERKNGTLRSTPATPPPLHLRRLRSAEARLRTRRADGLQGLAQGFAQDAHAAAVDYADARQAGEECAVDKFLHVAGGVVHVIADDVDFRGRVLAFVFVDRETEMPRARAAFTGESDARALGRWRSRRRYRRGRFSFSSRPWLLRSGSRPVCGGLWRSGRWISTSRYRLGRRTLRFAARRGDRPDRRRWRGRQRWNRIAREIRGAVWRRGARHLSKFSVRRRGPGSR